MPFCPECQAEYAAGINSCTDCDIALVAELPVQEPPDLEEGEPVRLTEFANAAEAKMVADVLEEAGIRAFVSGGDFTVAPSAFSSEIVLMVDGRDYQRALEVYDAYFGGAAEALESDEEVPVEDYEGGGEP
jgi:hypothetical protein